MREHRPPTKRALTQALCFICVTAAAFTLPSSVAPSSACAQGSERTAAARAFDRGTQAALNEDWEAAGQWFETADRLSPAPLALMNAMEARRRAGQDMRAATLALRAQETYPDDENVQAMAGQLLEGAAAQYVRVDVTCDDDCSVEVDGGLAGGTSFFVEPGVEHTVVAEFEHGRVEQALSGEAGETRNLSFEAPPAPVAPPAGPGQPLDLRDPFRFPKATFIIAAALTAGAGAVTIWSGVDTLNRVDAYEDAVEACGGGDCPEGRRLLADGQSRERRTNALIGTTAGLAAVTVVIGVLTDWDGSEEDEDPTEGEGVQDVQASAGITPGGAAVVVRGSF